MKLCKYNTSKDAQDLFLVHLINNLSSSIIPLSWITLTVFVVQTGSKSLKLGMKIGT